jgi:hypothetical protein
MRSLHFSLLLRPLILLIILEASGQVWANDIDQLKTKQDVEQFLVRKVSKEFKGERVFAGRPGQDSTDLPEWFYKVDIDGDGQTDLVINGLKFIVVIGRGRKGYVVRDIGRRHWEDAATRLRAIDSMGSWKGLVVWDRIQKRRDTLVYRLGNFIEYNAYPLEHLDLESLTFKAGGCYGKCPIFELRVTGDGHVAYHAEMFNDKKGDFSGVVPVETFEWIKSVLAYLPLDRLDSNYAVDWTDDRTVWLEVHYNGRVKRISDYGAIGSRGLEWVYGLLYGLRDKVEWQRL